MNRLLPLALLAGCMVTETGNPEFDAQFAMRATSSAPDVVDVDAPSGTTSVAEAWVSVDRVRFVRGAQCDGPGEEEIDIPGPFVTNTAAPVPDAITARLPEDDYCRVRLRLEPAESVGTGPAALLDHVVLLRGERTDGTPWEIRSTEDVDIDVRSAAPIPLSEAGASVIVAFDLAAWLEDVDFSTATVGGDGVIHVEEGSNEGLLEIFEDNLEEAVELLDDDDDDGEIDDDDIDDD